MSINPLLKPDSTENKTLNLYCNSITTATGTANLTTLEDHKNLELYFVNPANGGADLRTDYKQLVHKDGDYITIEGKISMDILTDGVGETTFFMVFDYPDLVSDLKVKENVFYRGGLMEVETNFWNGTNYDFDNTTKKFTLNFEPSNQAPTASEETLFLKYSFSYKTE